MAPPSRKPGNPESLSSASAASAVSFAGVSRHFGSVRAVDGVDLEIRPGEFFAMLGPSGSGKTTCLRLIAGFERPTSGHIRIFGETAEGLPPYRRNVNTVFQDYALFPHLDVRDNVAYGLMVRGVAKAARHRAAAEALELVKLPGYAARRPAQLSGGQRQRVALARALINKPAVLLLDEPLGALDLKLREQMQEELKSLQQALAITFVFVTHDQNEALSMADRIAVFNHGRVVQTGTPQEIYRQPRSRFIADFVGSSNVVPPAFTERHHGVRAWASLRPEDITVLPEEDAAARAGARIVAAHYQGAATRLIVDLDGISLKATIPGREASPPPSGRVGLSWPDQALHVMEEQPREEQPEGEQP